MDSWLTWGGGELCGGLMFEIAAVAVALFRNDKGLGFGSS